MTYALEKIPDLEALYPEGAIQYRKDHPAGSIKFLYDMEGNPESAIISYFRGSTQKFRHFSISSLHDLPESIRDQMAKYGCERLPFSYVRDLKNRIRGLVITINSEPMCRWMENQLESNAVKISEG